MKIIFTKHFLLRSRERNIDINLVRQSILNPDVLLPSRPNRYRVIKFIRKKNRPYLLVVIFDKVNGSFIVITAFITSKIDKYLK